MTGNTPNKRAITAYAAGIIAIGGLIAIVALGGNVVTQTNTPPAVSAAITR